LHSHLEGEERRGRSEERREILEKSIIPHGDSIHSYFDGIKWVPIEE
jgi:hypothetical protein